MVITILGRISTILIQLFRCWSINDGFTEDSFPVNFLSVISCERSLHQERPLILLDQSEIYLELRNQKCFINPGLIRRTSNVIGKGNFGEITLVFYDGNEYACKTLKRQNKSISEQETLEICQDLLKEANIMEGKEHENILRLVGISQVSFNIFHDSDVRDIFMSVT